MTVPTPTEQSERMYSRTAAAAAADGAGGGGGGDDVGDARCRMHPRPDAVRWIPIRPASSVLYDSVASSSPENYDLEPTSDWRLMDHNMSELHYNASSETAL